MKKRKFKGWMIGGIVGAIFPIINLGILNITRKVGLGDFTIIFMIPGHIILVFIKSLTGFSFHKVDLIHLVYVNIVFYSLIGALIGFVIQRIKNE